MARQVTELAMVHRQLQAVIDSITEGLIVADMRGNILLVNVRGAEMLGFTSPEEYHKALPEFIGTFELSLPGGARLPVERWPFNMLLHGETVRDYVVVVRRVEADRRITLSYNGSIARDEKGEPLYAVLTYRDVTAQIDAREALHRKEEELREAQRVARVGSWFWDARTDRVTVSDEIFELYGLDRAKPYPSLKEQEGTLLPPRSWEQVSAAIDHTLKTGEPYELEFEVNHGKGGTIWILAHGEAVYNPQGEGIGLRGTVQDITGRRQAEEALRRQAQLIDLSPDAIMVRGVDGTIQFWSRGAEALYGWTSKEVIGKMSHLLLNTRSLMPLDEIIAETIRVGRWSGELTHTTKGGQQVIVQSRWLTQCDSNGGVEGILESNLDITEGKMAEMALRESEERFRTMADSTPVMIWVTNAHGGIEFVNHAYEEFFGVTEAQVKFPASWKMSVHPDDEQGYLAAYTKAVQTQVTFSAEGRVRHHSGEWRWVHSYGAPRFSTDGRFLGHVGSSPDITAQKRAADALKASVENLRLMVSQASDAMMVIDSDGRIEALSSLASHLLGYEEGELLGKRIDQFAETFSRLETSLTLENLRKGAPRPMSSSLRVRTKAGIMQWVSVTGHIVDLGGQGEKYFVKFQKLELPAGRINPRRESL